MFKFPDPKTKDPKERRVQRALEMIPGTLTWSTLVGIFLLSYLFPVAASFYIIIFDLYWIFRAIFISYYSVAANVKMSQWKKINWWERCQKVVHVEEYISELEQEIKNLKTVLKEMRFVDFANRKKIRTRIKEAKKFLVETKKLLPVKDQILDWRTVVHAVVLPTAGEPADVIEPALQALADVNFPKSQMIVILATEERENPETRLPKVEYLQDKFKGVFKDFIVTTHEVQTGEMKCKASNVGYAAKHFQKYLDERNIDYKRVLFSNFDCDTVAHPEYFSALTYAFITTPQRLQRAYQPIPMYHNNIWDTNAIVRLVVTGSSFWHLFQSTRREMVTFSSHTESFDTLVKVGFWPVNMISEDSVIYWKCISYFDGNYEVCPIHLPVSLDAVLAETYWKTIQNQYKQKRRWAYGIENFPVTMRAIWPNKKIALFRKMRITFEMLEGHYSWATTSFILAFMGWLPLLLGGESFRSTVLANNLPFMTKNLMQIAMLGLLVSIPLSLISLPPKPERYHRSKYLVMFFQWMLSPVVAFLSAFPAIDSQTRILTKNYFGEFWVTEKMRKK